MSPFTSNMESTMKAKYIQIKERINQIPPIQYAVNPPDRWKQSIGATYEQFDTLKEAELYSIELEKLFADYSRSLNGRVVVDRNTVGGLFQHYKQSRAFQELAQNSRQSYLDQMNHALSIRLAGSNKTFGEYLARNITADHADSLYNHLKIEKSPHKALTMCKVMRLIWNVGFRSSKVSGNPFSKMKIKSTPPRTVVWTDEQIDKFIETADKLGRHSIATMVLLCLETCQRPVDIRNRVWGDIQDGKICLTQTKTGSSVEIPLEQDILDRLHQFSDSSDPSNYLIRCESTGKPFDRRLYAKWAQKVRKAAGLPDNLWVSDMRRTGATEIADSGATNSELRAVTGHKGADVLPIYVTRTVVQADSAMQKRAAYRKRKGTNDNI